MAKRSKALPQEKVDELARQQEVFEAMPSALKALTKKIRERVDRMNSYALGETWAMGQEIVKACEDRTGKYGPDPMGQMEVAVGRTRGHVTKMVYFARQFDKEMLDWMLAQRMAHSLQPITWNHIQQLVSVPKAEDRRRFIEMTFAEDLTYKELQDRIRNKLRPTTPKHAGGRPIKVPATFGGKLAKLIKVLGSVVRGHEQIWSDADHGIMPSLQDLPADRLRPEMVEQLDESLSLAETAISDLNSLMIDLKTAREVAASRLQAQAKEKGLAEASQIESGYGEGTQSESPQLATAG